MDDKKNKSNAPWSKYYNNIDMNLDIPDTNFYKYFENKVKNFGSLYSLDYYGTKIKYNELLKMVDECAKGFYNYGVRKGDIVTICLPNTIEGVVSFLAINKIGAIANFMHPLCSENEIKKSLNETNSKILVLLDTNFIKLKNIENDINVSKVILVSVYNYMPFIVNIIHKFSDKIKFNSREKELCVLWSIFISNCKKINIDNYISDSNKKEPCVILHSGGTTGTPKGVLLSNENIIAYIESEIKLSSRLNIGDTVLAVLPIFHGFGLITTILFSLCRGMFLVLKPRFDVNEYCATLKKYKPQALTGVPSLYESVFNKLESSQIKLDFLKYVMCGGDTLKPALREKINNILKQHGSDIKITEGYGLTEAVCAVAIENDFIGFKENRIGIPFPGFYIGIFSEKNNEVPYGEEGEICVSGPVVMLGYYNNEEETKLALQKHADGNIWLHTGDVGSMDEDGYLSYISRKKRMIISSGYNIYPNQIEKLLESHPAVKSCAVIGVPHKRKIEVPKVYILLNEQYAQNDLMLLELKMLCGRNLPKYAWPNEYEFIEQFPVTKLGKIDYNALKESNINKE